jgi:hypothetical protein
MADTTTTTSRLIGAALALLVAASPALAAPPAAPERPYSCRLLDDAARKCAFGACDQRERDRLTQERLRDGGRP